jgi:hypothetical protein
MTNEEQIDQTLCQIILDRQQRRTDDELSVGDVVRDFYLHDEVAHSYQGGGKALIAEATVEQRHLDAVKIFRENYPIRSAAGVNFRVAPKVETNVQ